MSKYKADMTSPLHNTTAISMRYSSSPVRLQGGPFRQNYARFCLFLLCELQITKSAPNAKSLSEITQAETHQDFPFGRAGHSFGRADHAIGHKHKLLSVVPQEAHRLCLGLLCELQITKPAPDTKSLSEITQAETHQDFPFARARRSLIRVR
jgi:hypothetical protein